MVNTAHDRAVSTSVQSWSTYWGYSGFGWVLRTTEQYGGCMLASGAYTVS